MTRRADFRLLSWNVAKRRAYRDQIEAISNVDPDIIALQEVSYRRSDALIEALSDLGFGEAHYSWDRTLAPAFKHGVLVASRWPLAAKVGLDVPYPESALSVEASSPYGPIEVTTVHVPNGSTYGVKKVETLEGVYEHYAEAGTRFRLLCGDFNTPYREGSDGRVVTFGQRVRKDGSVALKSDGGRQDRAERGVLLGLAEHGLRDAFRMLHGYGQHASSWRDFRLDHVFSSNALRPVTCRYLDELRASGLSDHAAIVADFEPE